MSVTTGNFWNIVKYENGILTTRRDGHRFEDFELVKDGLGVYANKHFGDHEHDSGTIIDVKHDGSIDQLNTLVKAAIQFHESKLWITKESEIAEMSMSRDEFLSYIEEFKVWCIGSIDGKASTQGVRHLQDSQSKVGVLLLAIYGFIDQKFPALISTESNAVASTLEDEAMNLPF